MLDVWPTLPLEIRVADDPRFEWQEPAGADNIVAALGHNDRIVKIYLYDIPLASSIWRRVIDAMQEPYPELTALVICSTEQTMTALPDSFLGGSAPSLRSFSLMRVPFPALPKLLASASGLVELDLDAIPDPWDISPNEMVTCLSSLTRLSYFCLGFLFNSSLHVQERRCLPPLSRTPLPALTRFDYGGTTEYLEDLFSQIDAPLLRKVMAIFFKSPIFEISQLQQFINRSETFRTSNRAVFQFHDHGYEVDLSLILLTVDEAQFLLEIPFTEPNELLSYLTHIIRSPFLPFPTLETLTIATLSRWRIEWSNPLLEILPSLAAVKDLHLFNFTTPYIIPVLTETTGKGLLPALQSLFLEWPWEPTLIQEVTHFVTTRQLSGHPVTIHRWNRW